MMIIWVILGLVLAFGLWLASTYNGLVVLRNQSINGWKQIDIQLKRRHDLIPNLVESVKGVMKFEQETLTKVIEARNRALSVQGVAEKAAQENVLTSALRQLFALAENYPQLKANENAAKLQEELVSTENRIGFARQFYNDIATKFNTAIQVFPANTIAGIFGFSEMELFEVKEAADRELPRVDLKF